MLSTRIGINQTPRLQGHSSDILGKFQKKTPKLRICQVFYIIFNISCRFALWLSSGFSTESLK
ncbi:hypothetical protein [Microcystis aeruginosa]|uniref:hypothetical protein n=1 Tax=Microcystis aeruginosa TaxID=1126 RepID=UPI00232B7AA4|nr:hypothetical protein [Microcystis aeruginosa]MDB9415168.1 hypothetical protein [Microcystis aeruginosa CS-556/03]